MFPGVMPWSLKVSLMRKIEEAGSFELAVNTAGSAANPNMVHCMCITLRVRKRVTYLSLK
jgi:hypothetical protein